MDYIEEQQIEIQVPRFSSDVEDRMEDFSHRVLDQGRTDALETLGVLGKKLALYAEDEQAFWYYTSKAYHRAYEYHTAQHSPLSDLAIPMRYYDIQQALTIRFLRGKTEEEALAVVMSPYRLWEDLQREVQAVSQRLQLGPLVTLLQNGYQKWKEKHEKLSRTPVWATHPKMQQQIRQLLEGLKRVKFVPKETKEVHFYVMLTSLRPTYRIIWSQKGLGSLFYLMESLLREGYIQAPEKIKTAAMRKEMLKHDDAVMAWLYDCISNVFLTTDKNGNLLEITRDKLREARISALSNGDKQGHLPNWVQKIDGLIESLEN
ncbi:hypothetical protein [Pontibacter vulgaris]|uniref:hypothetical protein n=1 Tax=Pontibacter vulgaris TaxID=2905679 RepID=UPI001FA7F268|nr:hypothetical protein [Pontibacter vulgaris]